MWSKCLTILFTIVTVVAVIAQKEGICTKEEPLTYITHKINPYTHRLSSKISFKRNVIFVCCDGYIEISRDQVQPTCKSICSRDCGYGACIGNDKCVCQKGYTLATDGTCSKRVENLLQTTLQLLPIDSSTQSWQIEQSTVSSSGRSFEQSPTNPANTKQSSYLDSTGITSSVIRHYSSLISPSSPPSAKTNTQSSMIAYRGRPKPDVETIEPTITLRIPSSLSNPPVISEEPLPRLELLQGGTKQKHERPCGTCGSGFCFDDICICPDGYKLSEDNNCHPICSHSCTTERCPNYCVCENGFAYSTETLTCKPLCDGKIYGCLRGICIGYNQCRCENGTHLKPDELFHCVDEEILLNDNHHWYRYLYLLILPALITMVSFMIVIKRWRAARLHRLEAQAEDFSSVIYCNSNNEQWSTEKIHRNCLSQNCEDDEPSCSRSSVHRNGRSVLIINT